MCIGLAAERRDKLFAGYVQGNFNKAMTTLKITALLAYSGPVGLTIMLVEGRLCLVKTSLKLANLCL